MTLPANHALRSRLNEEFHSRPSEALVAPTRLSYLALLSPAALRESERQSVSDLADRYHVARPAANTSHYSEDFGAFRLKWERHTEFARYTIIVPGADPADPFANPAVAAVPDDWLKNIPGEMICATHVAVIPATGTADHDNMSAQVFGGHMLVGSVIGGGTGRAFTDFRIRDDGFGRLLLHDIAMSTRQCGRMVQRLLEIETYRTLSLLALPVAQEAAPILTQRERELVQITQSLADMSKTDEAELLYRLTQLEATIESHGSENHYRFGAAAAYHELVNSRIAELREDRIEGMQTFREFIGRRLSPAMSTCRTVAARQESLSERVARATQLLSTRVDLARQRQNQAVLESMNRRAALQLRLQSTVEGLSIAAVTYYVVGLVGYLAKALKSSGVSINVDIAMGLSIPVVALLTAVAIGRIRKSVSH